MSRTWTRTARRTFCGRCGRELIVGTAIRVIGGLSGWKLTRCEACAGEAAPELPAYVPPARIEIPSAPIRRQSSVAQLARDWKAKQSKDAGE